MSYKFRSLMRNYNFEKLKNLRIHDLRDFARGVGVQSPTSKKKGELLNEIYMIQTGQTMPHISKNKQGRPLKGKLASLEHSQSASNGFVDEMAEKNVYLDYDYSSIHNMDFVLNLPKSSYNAVFGNEGGDSVKGVLDILQNGFGYLRVSGFVSDNNDCIVSPILIKEHSLKKGCHVSGNAQHWQGGKHRLLTKVKYFLPRPQSEKQPEYESIEHLPLSTALKNAHMVWEQNLQEGGKYFVRDTNFNDVKQNMLKALQNDYSVLVVNLNGLLEENAHNVFSENYVYQNLDFSLSEKQVASSLNLIVETAKRKMESGENVVLVINNFSAVLKTFNMLYSPVYEKNVLRETVLYFKNLLATAKKATQGSITLMLFDEQSDDEGINAFYNGFYFNLFTKVF